jgi:hypothetical protein
MKFLYLYLTTLLALFITSIKAQQEKNDSALVFYLSEYGLKTVQKNLIPAIFNNYPIPLPIPGAFEQKLDFIGKVKLNITELNLKFNNISDEQITIDFIDNNNTINITIKQITGNLNFTYDFQSGFYNNKATGNIIISDMSAEISTEVSTIINAKNPEKLGPNLQIKYLKVPKTPVLSISFDAPGRVEMLAKFFFDLISNSVSQTIVDNLSSEKVENLNKNITNFMANLELKNSFNNITVDYSLNSAPIIKNRTLEVAFVSVISADAVSNYTYNGTKYAVPHMFYGEAPVYGFFNQYLIDGFFDVMQFEGKLKGFVPSELVQTALFSLDVKGVSKFLPTLSNKYNASDKVDLNISSLTTPQISFKDQKLKAAFNFAVDILVRNSQNENITEIAASLNFKLIADLGFSLQNAKLKIKVKSIEFTDVQVISSNIGEIDTEKMKSNLNLNVNIILLIYSTFNYDLGIFLPKIAGISLNQTTIVTHDGYLEFGIIPQPEKKLGHLAFLVEDVKEEKSEKAAFFDFAKETFNMLKEELEKSGNKEINGNKFLH